MPTHAEQRSLPYSAKQLYDLVADVASYPEFLPWCIAVRINSRKTLAPDDNSVLLEADMVIGFKIFREKFTSHIQCQHPDRIDVTYSDGPFRYLNNHWVFRPINEASCEIDFFVDFEFKSLILQKAIGLIFNEAVQKMVDAFETRADSLYGSPR